MKSWQSKRLSYGGKATLVKHIIQSMPLYISFQLFPLLQPPQKNSMIMVDFFWGWTNDKNKYHWLSWNNLHFPYDDEGIGVRIIRYVCQSFQNKQWWNFRSMQTLWGDFLRSKYCQWSKLVSKQRDIGHSQAWRHMMRNKHTVETHIQWKIKSSSCSFYGNSALGVVPHAQFTRDSNRLNNDTVSEFIEGQWNRTRSFNFLLKHKFKTFLLHNLKFNKTYRTSLFRTSILLVVSMFPLPRIKLGNKEQKPKSIYIYLAQTHPLQMIFSDL